MTCNNLFHRSQVVLSLIVIHFITRIESFGCESCFSNSPPEFRSDQYRFLPGDRIELEVLNFDIDGLRCGEFSQMGNRATIMTSNIWNLENRVDKVASLSGFCICIDYYNAVLDCQQTLRINDSSAQGLGTGTITIRGPISLKYSKWYLGIVGTTGDFENLKGDVEITDYTDVTRRDRSLQVIRGDNNGLDFRYYITFR